MENKNKKPDFINRYLNINKMLLFLILCSISIAALYIYKNFILNQSIYLNSYGDQLSTERIKNMISGSRKFAWIGYVKTPFSLIIKLSAVSLLLNIGSVLYNVKIGFKKLFGIVLLAEPIFILSSLTKIAWMYFNSKDLTLQTIHFFYPLSLTNLFSINEVPKWLINAFQTINLFEISYWFILAYFLKDIIKKPFWKSFEFVLSTYGVGLFIWVVLMAFLRLSLS